MQNRTERKGEEGKKRTRSLKLGPLSSSGKPLRDNVPGQLSFHERECNTAVWGKKGIIARLVRRNGIFNSPMNLSMLLILSIPLLSISLLSCSLIKGKPVPKTIDDQTIVADIESKIQKDLQLTFLKIKVESRQGNVTLSGQVPSKGAELQAVRLAQSSSGVVSVRSSLVILGGTPPQTGEGK